MADVVPRAELAQYEAVIERGLATFVEVGEALLAIRDKRLYRESHSTFEDYCRERWGMNRQRASQLIQAADVSKVLDSGPRPASDSVARELAPLRDTPEELREAWTEAVEQHGEQPTAKQVREIVRGSARKPPAGRDLVSSIAAKCGLIVDLAPHLDADVIRSLPSEDKETWQQQLRAARTIISQVLKALA